MDCPLDAKGCKEIVCDFTDKCVSRFDASHQPSGSLSGCIADKYKESGFNRSKAKRCWICGNKLRGGKSYPRTIDGHKRDLHKFCAEDHDKAEARSDNAFGMNY
jgi:hypothetical protein